MRQGVLVMVMWYWRMRVERVGVVVLRVVLHGVHCAVGVHRISWRRRGRAHGWLGPWRTKDWVMRMRPTPNRLLMVICEFMGDSWGLLWVIHRIWRLLGSRAAVYARARNLWGYTLSSPASAVVVAAAVVVGDGEAEMVVVEAGLFLFFLSFFGDVEE